MTTCLSLTAASALPLIPATLLNVKTALWRQTWVLSDFVDPRWPAQGLGLKKALNTCLSTVLTKLVRISPRACGEALDLSASVTWPCSKHSWLKVDEGQPQGLVTFPRSPCPLSARPQERTGWRAAQHHWLGPGYAGAAIHNKRAQREASSQGGGNQLKERVSW